MVALSDLFKQAILVIGVAALAIAGDAGLVAFLAIQLPIGALSLAIMPLMVGRADRAWPRWHLDEWAHIGLRALPVAAAAILAMVYVRVLTIMASLLTTDREVGLFVTSARIVEMVGALALLLAGIVLPVAAVAAQEDRGRLGYVLRRTTEVSFLLGGLIALVLVIAATPIVELLGGEEYSDAGPVLAIQGLAIVTIFLVQAWITFLIADHRQRDLVRAIVVGLVSVFVAGLLLIPPYGANGAALAAVIADVTYAGTVYFMVRGKVTDIAPVTLGFVAKVTLAALPAVVIAFLPGLHAIVAAALGALAFIVLKTVPPDVWSSLPSWPRRR
jgi:O-antigen/teichoic acid export membrane protein